MATVRGVTLALLIAFGSTVGFGQQSPPETADPLASAFREYQNLLDQAEGRSRWQPAAQPKKWEGSGHVA